MKVELDDGSLSLDDTAASSSLPVEPSIEEASSYVPPSPPAAEDDPPPPPPPPSGRMHRDEHREGSRF